MSGKKGGKASRIWKKLWLVEALRLESRARWGSRGRLDGRAALWGLGSGYTFL